MKTLMQDTSLATWQRIQPTIGKKQYAVLNLLSQAARAGMDMTDTEIANALHWKINCVTPRRNELVKMGLVVKSQRRWNGETQAYNWSWKAKP